MSKTEDGGPAFPQSHLDSIEDPTDHRYSIDIVTALAGGLTVRDYFAGQALAGICANPAYVDATLNVMAGEAFQSADAMLRAREQEQDGGNG